MAGEICPATVTEEHMVWLDWLIITLVVLLAAVIFKYWRERPRLINELDPPAQRAGSAGAAIGDAEGSPRPWGPPQGVTAKQKFTTGTQAFSCYRHKFEALTQEGGDEAAALWEPITALAFEFQPRAPLGFEHLQGVSKLAARIATHMRLSEPEIEEIRVAALVHDIGKTRVPDPVRLKPKMLTPEEFELMKSHAAWGARMLAPLGEEGIEQIVLHHHERFDGKGYPDHLIGEAIPLGARIVALAECFDSMLTAQAYKAPRRFEDAVAEVRRCSGTQFDPNVVAAFLSQLLAAHDSGLQH